MTLKEIAKIVVKPYGNEITVGEILKILTQEELTDHFERLGESVLQEGRIEK